MTHSMRHVGLVIGLAGLLVFSSAPGQSQEGGSFTEIFGIRATNAEALQQAASIQRLGENAPPPSGPDFLQAEEGKPSTFAFYLWHDCPRARTYLFTLLIDNRQVIFEIEGQGLGDFIHGLTVEPKVPLVREFNIPGLSEGLHNIALAAFPQEGECFQFPLGFIPRNLVLPVAISVLAGLESPPDYTVAHPAPESFKPGIEKQELPATGIWLGLSAEPVILREPSVSLKPNERFDYFIYARNDIYPELREWAIVAFIEAMQVPIGPFNTPMVWYESVLLPNRHEITLPASLVAPREPGRYRLVVMMFGEPYRLTTQQTLWMPSLHNSKQFELRVEESSK